MPYVNAVKSIHLECLHTLQMVTPPMIGESVFCFRCDDYKRVVKAPPRYSTRCMTCRRCKGQFESARLSAETFIVKHRQRYPSHTVGLYDGMLLVREFRPLAESMPSLLDEPPF